MTEALAIIHDDNTNVVPHDAILDQVEEELAAAGIKATVELHHGGQIIITKTEATAAAIKNIVKNCDGIQEVYTSDPETAGS